MVTRDDVSAGYRLVLGRPPEDHEMRAACARAWDPAEFGSWLVARRGEMPGREKLPFADHRRHRDRAEAAQSRRLGRRVEEMREELDRAQAALAQVEASLAWKITGPFRTAAAILPPPLRRHAARAARAAWWTATLRFASLHRAWHVSRRRRAQSVRAEHPAPPDEWPLCRPKALVIDNRWPQPDRDSGSVDMINLIEALLAFGFQVTFVADTEFDLHSCDRESLAGRGVRCIDSLAAPSTGTFLQREGPGFALCVLSRVYGGGRFLEDVMRHCPAARLVFLTVDLHFLRARREAAVSGSISPASLSDVRAREELLVREADATMVVSSAERAILNDIVPDAYVVELPLARAVRPGTRPFRARHGVGFLGGFAHAPNVDAVRWFLDEIWPLAARDLPDCTFSIVGADLPPRIAACLPPGVRYLGHLPDLGPWFGALRLTVAPLRFGAGAKGKIASSLAAGVPCVTTTIGAEGMGLRDGETVLVADTPAAFVDRMRDAYTDPVLWTRLSDTALAHAAQDLSPARWRLRLRDMLETIGALPPAPAGTDRQAAE